MFPLMMMVMVELWFKLARDFLTVGSKPTQLLILEATLINIFIK